MFILFSLHHWNPRRYVEMDAGERTIVDAFIEYEQEQIRSDLDQLKGK